MSGYYDARQVLDAVSWQKRQLDEQDARLRSFADWHRQQRKGVEAELQQATRDLGIALLPRLDAASISRAANVTGLTSLLVEHIPEAVAAERARLEGTLRQILADPRYRDRELLRHPRTGTLPRQLAEMTAHRKPWFDILRVCEAHPRFQRLLDASFGTPEYTSSWWRLSYHQDHAAAKEILASFPPGTDFGTVRSEYFQAKDTVAKLDAELDRIHREIAAGEALDRQYAAAYEALRTLDDRWLAHVRDRLVRHLASVNPSVLAPAFDREPTLRTLFLRATGLGHKLSYLDSLAQQKLQADQQEIALLRQKIGKIEAQQNRKRNGMPVEKFASTFKDRRARWDKGWQRFGKGYQRVVVYDRYHYAPLGSDFLWWDLMTDGRVDGRFIPDVDHYYRHHPGYVYERPRRPYEPDRDTALDTAETDVEAAAAAVESDRSPISVGGADVGGGAEIGGADGS